MAIHHPDWFCRFRQATSTAIALDFPVTSTSRADLAKSMQRALALCMLFQE
ncbi:MAG: hypothetical protein WCP63_06520 [Cyanobium sp. ELA712]